MLLTPTCPLDDVRFGRERVVGVSCQQKEKKTEENNKENTQNTAPASHSSKL